MKRDIEQMPGTFENRVFVGGNYDLLPTLREIEKYIKKTGFQPIIAFDFKPPPAGTYDYDLRLLHRCKYAVFDITIASGALMELGRGARDFNTFVFAVYNIREDREMPAQVSSMVISLGIPMFGFRIFKDLKKFISGIFPAIEQDRTKALCYIYQKTKQLPQVASMIMDCIDVDTTQIIIHQT